MREIKFRAWDKTKKEMILNSSLGFEIDATLQEFVEVYLGGVSEDVVMLQYTGLKDKNGKDIYEGDILNTGDIHVGKVLGVVSYQAPRWMYEAHGGKINGVMTEIAGIGRLGVIGNIYENPELL